MRIDQSWYVRPEIIRERPAAGGVILRRDGESWLIGLIRDPKYQDYLFPKGGVEINESLEEAARREIYEESGLSELQLIAYLGKNEHLSLHKKTWAIIHLFLYTTTQMHGTSHDPDGKQYLLEWFPIDGELPEMFWPDQKVFLEENLEKFHALVER